MEAVKLRYLQALGIERWIPRSQPRPSPDAVQPEMADPVEERAEEVAATVSQLAEEPVAAVRQLLDVAAGAPAAPVPAATTTAIPESAPPAAVEPTTVPECRFSLLELQGALLLVDETLLAAGAMEAEQVHLLGDVLRTARLLQSGDAAGQLQRQVFYWPQVDDPTLDQGLPRAQEALAFLLRQRSGDGSGPLLWILAEEDGDSAASEVARGGLDACPGEALLLPAGLLDLDATAVRQQVWRRLCTWAAASPGREA